MAKEAYSLHVNSSIFVIAAAGAVFFIQIGTSAECAPGTRPTVPSIRDRLSDLNPTIRDIRSRCSGCHRSRGVTGPLIAQLSAKPDLCDCPVALHRCRRDVQRTRNLLDGKAAEEPHLHYLRLSYIQLFQLTQRLIDSGNIQLALVVKIERVIECDSDGVSPASLLA